MNFQANVALFVGMVYTGLALNMEYYFYTVFYDRRGQFVWSAIKDR